MSSAACRPWRDERFTAAPAPVTAAGHRPSPTPSSHPAHPAHPAPSAHPARQPTPREIGRAATLALYDELALTPKPGLVTLTSRGSHEDMDARTFLASLVALRGYFVAIAELGARHAPFAELERCGLEAEARMLAATRGINTHRGAIFLLGLLCAAAGWLVGRGEQPTAAGLRAGLIEGWGDDLAVRARRPSRLPGGIAARRLGLRGAAAEAAAGFPILFEVGLPALARAQAQDLSPRLARLDALFAVMAELDDCNLAHRGGAAGLAFARQQARGFIAAGGAARPDAIDAAERISAAFVARRLSPGGSADTLSAVCWAERLGCVGAPF